KQHTFRLRRIMNRLADNGLTVCLSKCAFGTNSVTFLGFSISPQGIRPAESLTSKIANITPPRNGHEVKSILGLLGYLRKHVPHFSNKLQPLLELTKKDTPFV